MPNLLSLLTNLPPTLKRILVYLSGSLSLLALGFVLGRYATPPRTVTKTEYVDKIKVVKVKVRAVDTTKVTKTTKDPNGTEHTETTEHTTSHTETDTTRNESDRSKATTSTGYQPQWRVGALGGALIRPGSTPTWLVGPQVERRIVGPVWLGAWGLGGPGGGAVGASLTVEF